MAARWMSVFAVLALSVPSLAGAEELQVSPRRLEAQGGPATREVQLANHGATPMRIELHALAWDQTRDGQSQLTPTDELAASPASLTLAPGESRAVRVELGRGSVPFELAYQLVVEAKREGATAAEQVAIPVFVEPQRSAPRAEMSPPQLLGCTAMFELRNSGNAHLEVKSVRLAAKDSAGRVVAAYEHALPDVLSGVVQTVSEILPHAACSAATVLTAEIETSTGQRQAADFLVPQSAVLAKR